MAWSSREVNRRLQKGQAFQVHIFLKKVLTRSAPFACHHSNTLGQAHPFVLLIKLGGRVPEAKCFSWQVVLFFSFFSVFPASMATLHSRVCVGNTCLPRFVTLFSVHAFDSCCSIFKQGAPGRSPMLEPTKTMGERACKRTCCKSKRSGWPGSVVTAGNPRGRSWGRRASWRSPPLREWQEAKPKSSSYTAPLKLTNAFTSKDANMARGKP